MTKLQTPVLHWLGFIGTSIAFLFLTRLLKQESTVFQHTKFVTVETILQQSNWNHFVYNESVKQAAAQWYKQNKNL